MSTRQRISLPNGRANGRVALPALREDLSLSKAALLYAVKFQLCIFPVLPLKKRPAYGGHGWKSATGNEVQIKRWWSENPDYNIGIALPFSGLAVLDIDPRHGGDRNLAALIEKYGPLPDTYVVATGGRGQHYYFKFEWDPDCDYPKKLADGVELLRNGYVIAPPSDTSNAESGGGPYRVQQYNDGHLAPLPTRWVEAIISGSRRRADDERLPQSEDWFLQEGERNEQITRYMGAMRRYGFTADELVAMVEAWGPDRIENFESVRSELPTIARSVAKYEPESYGFEGVRISVRTRKRRPELDEENALIGPIGAWVRYIADRSESHPAALLMQALAIFGNRTGAEQLGDATPGFQQGASYHRLGLYVMVIGESGIGAKGDSWDYASQLMREVDPTFVYHKGVQTGEGFIDALADDQPTGETATIQGKKVGHVKKGGQADRRYFNFEPEYGRVLHVASRPGATIQDIVRDLWDHGDTEKVTAGSKQKVTEVTLSIVAHITPPELERDLDEVDLMSGYGNRFLFCWTRRTKHLPFEKPVPADDLAEFAKPLRRALDFAFDEAPEAYEFAPDAEALWNDFSAQTKRETHPSAMVNALKGRARPQVRRLAIIYAVAQLSEVIEARHLRAAMAVWDYSVQTVEYCLTSQIGDKRAARLYQALLANPTGLSRKEQLSAVFKGGIQAKDLDYITRLLIERGLAEEVAVKGKTKSARVLIATKHRDGDASD